MSKLQAGALLTVGDGKRRGNSGSSHLLTVTWGEGSTEASMTLGVLRGKGGGSKKHNGEVCLAGMPSVGAAVHPL